MISSSFQIPMAHKEVGCESCGRGVHLFSLSCQYTRQVNAFPRKVVCGSSVGKVDWPHAASLEEGGKMSRRMKIIPLEIMRRLASQLTYFD